jgi:hypothetical protein
MAERLITQDCAVGVIVGSGRYAASAAVIEVTERFRKPTIAHRRHRAGDSPKRSPRRPSAWRQHCADAGGDAGAVAGGGRRLQRRRYAMQAAVIAENSAAGDLFVEQTNEWFPTGRHRCGGCTASIC